MIICSGPGGADTPRGRGQDLFGGPDVNHRTRRAQLAVNSHGLDGRPARCSSRGLREALWRLTCRLILHPMHWVLFHLMAVHGSLPNTSALHAGSNGKAERNRS